MEDVVKMILASMSRVSKPQNGFILVLLSTLMIFQGKATFKNLSRYSGLHEKTFSRWFRRKFDFTELNQRIISHEIPTGATLIGAVDASFVSKSGKCTDGLGNFWNGSRQQSERGLEISSICVVDMEANTAYALNAKQTIDTDSDDEVRTSQYSEHLEETTPALKALGIKYVAADALYSNKTFIGTVIALGFFHVGRLRADANLKWLYNGPRGKRGRPKKYDGKVNLSDGVPDRFEYEGQLDDGSHIYYGIVWNVNLKMKVKVVLLHKIEGNREAKVLLFSTDLEIEPLALICYYKARFQIEFVFRDAKQYTGLTDCQSCRKEAIHTHINASLTALNWMKFEDRRKQGCDTSNVISIASWKRRKFNQNLMRNIFDKLGLSPTCQKIEAVYKAYSEYGAIAA